jgi:hypothetical protein
MPVAPIKTSKPVFLKSRLINVRRIWSQIQGRHTSGQELGQGKNLGLKTMIPSVLYEFLTLRLPPCLV